MAHRVCCSVFTKHDPSAGFAVDIRHYDELKDMVDTNQTGWVDLDSVYGDGKVLLRVQDIRTLVLSTESYVEQIAADQVVDG